MKCARLFAQAYAHACVIRHQRVFDKQRRLRPRKHVLEHGWELCVHVQTWVWLQRSVSASVDCTTVICCLYSTRAQVDSHLPEQPIDIWTLFVIPTTLCLENSWCNIYGSHKCDPKRKCLKNKDSYICGNCPVGYTNDGPFGCKGSCLSVDESASEYCVVILPIDADRYV